MKARNNNTGEIVTNFGFSKEFGTVSYIDSKGALTFNIPSSGEWTIIDNESTFDWQSFRAEAAKDILCSVILTFEAKESFDKSLDNAINNSIKAADKLISKLKEKKEK